MKRIWMVALVPLLGFLYPSMAKSAVGVECVDGVHQISLTLSIGHGVVEPGQGFILKREAIGICEDPVFLPDEPIPYTVVQDNPSFGTNYIADIALDVPNVNVAYRYTGYFVESDGSLTEIPGLCGEPHGYGLAGCGSAPIARGKVLYSTYYISEPAWTIQVCENNCWSESVWIVWTDEEMETQFGPSWVDFLGEEVDIYGHRVYCPMMGDWSYDITGMELSPTGTCDPVSVSKKTFGGFRSIYR